MYYLCIAYTVQADMAQLVEQRIRNAWVTSSSLVIGSYERRARIHFCLSFFLFAVIAQLVEQRLPKPQVTGSSPAYRSSISAKFFLEELGCYAFTRFNYFLWCPLRYHRTSITATVWPHVYDIVCQFYNIEVMLYNYHRITPVH